MTLPTRSRPAPTVSVRRRHRLRPALAICLCATAAVAQAPRITSPSPVKNYSLSFFSDTGYHSMHVRGGTADVRDPGKIILSDLTITLFTGDASRAVETVILSPRAVLEPAQQVVAGPHGVRLIRQDLEVSGQAWRYDHPAKRILIGRRARIVFNAELADLLK